MLNLLLKVKPQNTKYGQKSEFDFTKKKKGLKWQNCKEIILVTNIIGSDQKVAGFVFLC